MPRRTPSTGDPALKTPARRALREQIRRLGLPCQASRCLLPGVPVDYRTGARGPAAYVLGEIHPRWLGGDPADPANVRPEHWRCNAAAGAAITNTIRRARSRRRRHRPATATRW